MNHVITLALAIILTAWAVTAPPPVAVTIGPISPLPPDSLATVYGIPPELGLQIHLAARAHDIPPEIAFALVNQESRFDPIVIGGAGEVGLTQLLPTTATSECGLDYPDLFRPTHNLNCGFSFLSGLYDWLGTWRLALIAYNRGPQRTLNEVSLGLSHGSSEHYASSILTSAM